MVVRSIVQYYRALALSLALLGAAPLAPDAFAGCSVTGLSHWRIWADTSKDFKFGIEPSTQHKGKSSMVIQTPPDLKQNDFGGVYQEFRAEQFRNKRVRLSGWIKSTKLRGGANLWLVVEGPDKAIAFAELGTKKIVGTTDWRYCSVVSDVPAETKRLMIGFIAHGSGKVWLSDLELIPISSKGKTNNIPVDEMKFPMEGRYGEAPRLAFRKSKDTGRQRDWGEKIPQDYEEVVEETAGPDGQPAVHISGTNADARKIATIWQTINARDYAGQRWRFSGYIKSQDLSDGAGLWMRADGNDKILTFDDMEDRLVKGTTDWKRYSVVVDIPKESYSFKIGFLQNGKGSSWLSGCTFDKVGTDVPLTAKPSTPVDVPRPEVLDKPHLDFE